jgi:hypothetical protein
VTVRLVAACFVASMTGGIGVAEMDSLTRCDQAVWGDPKLLAAEVAKVPAIRGLAFPRDLVDLSERDLLARLERDGGVRVALSLAHPSVICRVAPEPGATWMEVLVAIALHCDLGYRVHTDGRLHVYQPRRAGLEGTPVPEGTQHVPIQLPAGSSGGSLSFNVLVCENGSTRPISLRNTEAAPADLIPYAIHALRRWWWRPVVYQGRNIPVLLPVTIDAKRDPPPKKH